MIILAILFFQLLNLTQIQANCDTKCGDIPLKYPFSTDPSCAHDGFLLTCDQSNRTPKLFIGNGSIEVLNISLHDGTILVKTKVVSSTQLNYNESWTGLPTSGPYSLSSQNKFVASGCGVLAQLNSNQMSPHQQVVSACASVCVGSNSLPTDGSCTGIGCCVTSLPNISLSSVNFELKSLNETPISAQGLVNKVFIVEQGWFSVNAPSLEGDFINGINGDNNTVIPALLDWRIGNSGCEIAEKNLTDFACKSVNGLCKDSNNSTGYWCRCKDGFKGSPYEENGCQDINECKDLKSYPCEGICINTQGSYNCVCADGTYSADPKTKPCVPDSKGMIPLSGVLIIIGVGIFVCLLSLPIALTMLMYKLRARRAKKLKEKFFKQNHGFLLEQLISAKKDIAEKLKIFNLEELEKATHKFDPTRIVGRGGHGTVYKGILSDQRVVAIKKSKIKVQREINEFINEVVILSEINHRNIVKLFGCCLETEVPLLVYEFISNGALSDHLHKESEKSLAWEERLRIALETSRALAYLHTSASNSIFHRDIKTQNILLDDNLTAKLSDFGASRSVPINQTGVTTVIQGTYGYLDPEYYYTGRLTEKSDVYSFGVILVELLTREKPVSCTRFPEGGNLAANFIMFMQENRLFDILDPQIVEEGRKSEIKSVANLAEECLSFGGEDRPTMKQVEMKLEKLQNPKRSSSTPRRRNANHPWTPQRLYETESAKFLASTDGSGSSGDMTRQYSLEEEFSVENYPR
ncbi:hypothetical protein LUZ60_003331 [Juncus effusus]|nr:hypothetical protein LUZ60_003331 [Juncus effusus]